METLSPIARRNFLKSTVLASAGTLGLSLIPTISHAAAEDERENVIGPRAGYSPYTGTLVSMMTWMRNTVLESVKGLRTEELDYIHDKDSNSIGAMLLHLAATERFYQLNTFEGKNNWSDVDKKRFEAAMDLGDKGRKTIKGNPLTFYMATLTEVRDNTLKEFKKRDDKWLLTVDETWGWGPTNNFCKWFHVCEHESNHNGQIKFIKGRLPN